MLTLNYVETYHCLEADRLDEAIDNLCKRLRAHPRTANLGRIAVHAFLPLAALDFYCGDPGIRCATVSGVAAGAQTHLCEDALGVLLNLLVDVASDRQVEAEDGIEDEENYGEVKKDLDVVGGDEGEFAVGRDPVGRGRLGGAAPGPAGVGGAREIFGVRVRVIALFFYLFLVFFALEYSDARHAEVAGGELRLSSSPGFGYRAVAEHSAPELTPTVHSTWCC